LIRFDQQHDHQIGEAETSLLRGELKLFRKVRRRSAGAFAIEEQLNKT
jgi:hypothetical protein